MLEKTILIVDDEKPIADILQFNLTKEGYEVYCAHDGLEAVKKVNEIKPDLILLDIMLPLKDGLEVCREVRKTHDMPIIMLTAKDSELDIVLGLEMGADDYMTKPFSTRELIARVKANLRRHQSDNGNGKDDLTGDIIVGDLLINPSSYIVRKKGQDIHLTHREFELICYLARHIGQVLTREHLLQTVWGYDYFGDVRTVDVTIRRMREKIEDNASAPQWIITRRGVGYYLNNPL